MSLGETGSVGVSDEGEVDVTEALEGCGTVSVAKVEPSVMACIRTDPWDQKSNRATEPQDMVVAGIDKECFVCFGVLLSQEVPLLPR